MKSLEAETCFYTQWLILYAPGEVKLLQSAHLSQRYISTGTEPASIHVSAVLIFQLRNVNVKMEYKVSIKRQLSSMAFPVSFRCVSNSVYRV
jgi:hypothetical protein